MQQKDDSRLLSFTFSKKERICSRLIIENLIGKKQSLFSYPFKCYYEFVPASEAEGNQMAISVPKRMVKTAVARNLVKRRTREAYRLNKHLLIPATIDRQMALRMFFVFVGKEIPTYNFVQDKIIAILQRLISVKN